MAIQEQDLKKHTDELQRALNEQLANWAVIYVKLHHDHWFVTGPHFQALHEKFEQLYDMAAEKLDELAERMLAIGLKPASTMKEYLALASIKEAVSGAEKDTDMLQGIAGDFRQMIEGSKQAVKLAERSDDAVTADIMTGFMEDLQKQMWMLNAMLGQ